MKALIYNDRIVQVTDTEFPVAPGLQWVECPEDCTTAWSYAAGVFTQGPAGGHTIEDLRSSAALGPMELADRLEALGIFDVVNTWANTQGGKIAYAWNRATLFERTHPLVSEAQIALGMTDAQVDALFGIVQ